jgi:hypothetical protein
MGRSIRSRTALTFAVACTALGVFAGTAGASNGNHGYSGGAATNSCSAPSGGIANAGFDTPAGYRSESYTTNTYAPFPTYPYYCIL